MRKLVVFSFFLILGCHEGKNNSNEGSNPELNKSKYIIAFYKCLVQNKLFESKSHFLILAGKELWVQDCYFVSKNTKGLFLVDHFKFAQIGNTGNRPFLDTCLLDIPSGTSLISYKNVSKAISIKSFQIINEKTFKDTEIIKGGFDPNFISIYQFSGNRLIRMTRCLMDNSYLDQKYAEFVKIVAD